MKSSNNKLSSAAKGLKYKLRISLYLMSILPLLVSIYLVSNYIFPQIGLKPEITVSMTISACIAMIGFFVIKQVFDRILAISSEAKLIAAGDITRRLEVPKEDEVSELGDALNQLTLRIRNNMDELKTYGEKTTEINLEIQKRVLVLSSLLQISSLISQSEKLEDILKLTVEKSRFIADSQAAFLLFKEDKGSGFYLKVSEGLSSEASHDIKFQIPENAFNRVLESVNLLLLDKQNFLSEELRLAFQQQLKIKNVLAVPVYLKGKLIGILGVGNSKENFLFRKDEVELIDIFAKQVAIAVENDFLMHRIEKLEIKDPLTGLYNQTFINNRLQEEIKRAVTYQRPCAYILLNIDNFSAYSQNLGALQAEGTLKKIAVLIRDSVTEIDRVGRVGYNEFAVVLPEKNKRQAQLIAEELKKKIQFSFSEEADQRKKLSASCGVSENPLDGVTVEELISKAEELVKRPNA